MKLIISSTPMYFDI